MKKNILTILKKNKLDKKKILSLFDKISDNTILIIGDFILDIYTECIALGKTSKTPTLSVKKIKSNKYLGGAGLFANIISNLECKANFITVMGNDSNAKNINKLLNTNLNLEKIIDTSRPTTSKERFWVDGYKLLQLDVLENHYISKKIETSILQKYKSKIKSSKSVILSDSCHGMMSPNLISELIKIAKKNKIPVILDSQLNSSVGNLKFYKNIDILSANERELREYTKNNSQSLLKLARNTFNKLKIKKYLIIKLGSEGLYLLDKNQHIHFPSVEVNSLDPIGSGDTLLSVFAICISNKFTVIESLFFATCAAAYSTTFMGTRHIDKKDLKDFIKKVLINLK
ncbi:PfkB family carbohydrate kinase [Alphaproteobacteria bacterium]|jgi:rfaE bifunctional protein kinase chain/domain|nr:PfkB family carbohydrate kinase [Alphaproteobacteria bacterium]